MVKVTVSHSAWYNPKNNVYTHQVRDVIQKYLPDLLKEFEVSKDLRINIRPIPQKRKGNFVVFGQCRGNLLVEVDCRSPRPSFVVETLAHEMTHAEQYFQGRLGYRWNDNVQMGLKVWQNVEYDRPKSFEEYMNLPWEIEARDRAAKFVNEYYKGF